MTERTREQIWGNGETVRGSRDEEGLRCGYKVFVIGKWLFVIGHLEKSDPLLGGAEAEGFGWVFAAK